MPAVLVRLPAQGLRQRSLHHRLRRQGQLADPAGHPFDLCLFPAKQETTLMGVMLDCPDAKELSTF